MALLIDIDDPDWMTNEELAAVLRPLLSAADIRCAPDIGDPAEIEMLAIARLKTGQAGLYPNLKLVQKLGAGVETIVTQPDLPLSVRVARLKPETPAREIAEYCLAYVLREQRNVAFHEASQKAGRWVGRAPRQASRTTVGVLGLGHIGGRTASVFAALGYRVIGWSRSEKAIEGVDSRCGGEGLLSLLAESDYVLSILPSTPRTRDLFDAGLFGAMKPGAILINAGRGDLVVEAALLAALEEGPLGGAVLDVQRREPLPPGHPFWTHPRITITPHVSGWHLTGGLEDVAENYRRLQEGRPLLHEVDRATGY